MRGKLHLGVTAGRFRVPPTGGGVACRSRKGDGWKENEFLVKLRWNLMARVVCRCNISSVKREAVGFICRLVMNVGNALYC